ncbi:MAG: serine/threonine-protein kinase [Cyanobacteria bacterium J06621_3]
MATQARLSSGDTLYKYELKQPLGRGSFGEVWLAHDLTISRDVAVKILNDPSVSVATHLQEAQVGNKLTHQNVVTVHYADVVSISQYQAHAVIIVMDYHSSGSTVSHLNSSNFMPVGQAVCIAIDILRGLEYLHEQNLFHNDIKPSNVLIGSIGEGILTDYGISCISQDLQPAQAPNAYVLHAAPETIDSKQISVLTDIYQVGMTLFRLINGIGLIQEQANRLGKSAFENKKKQGKVPDSKDYKPFVTRQLKTVINKATQVDSKKRYQSALEMRRSLESISIPGYWTTDPSGNYLGYSYNSIFTFQIQSNRNGMKFEAFRENQKTGRKTRISNYSHNALTDRQCYASQKKFMQAVIQGTV